MVKKTTFMALAAAAILTFSNITSALAYPHPGIQPENSNRSYISHRMERMDETQKMTWTNWKAKRLALEKKILKRQAEWGWISNDQVDQRLDRMMTWSQHDFTRTSKVDREEGALTKRPRKLDSKEFRKIEIRATLSLDQATQMSEWRQQKSELKKEWLGQIEAWGWITKGQSEFQQTKLDQWSAQPTFKNTKQEVYF